MTGSCIVEQHCYSMATYFALFINHLSLLPNHSYLSYFEGVDLDMGMNTRSTGHRTEIAADLSLALQIM